MNLITRNMPTPLGSAAPQSFLRPLVQVQSKTKAEPQDSLKTGSSSQSRELEMGRRLLELRSKAAKSGPQVSREQVGAELVKGLDHSAERLVVDYLDNLQEASELANPAREALNILGLLKLEPGKMDLAATAVLNLMKSDPERGGLTKAACDFVKERVGNGNSETPNTGILECLSSSDPGAELIHHYGAPHRTMQEVHKLKSLAKDHGETLPTLELAVEVFGSRSKDNFGLEAFFAPRDESGLRAQQAARTLDGVQESEQSSKREKRVQSAFQWLGKHDSRAQGHVALRMGAIAAENGWRAEKRPLELALKSVAQDQNPALLIKELLPQEEPEKAMTKLAMGHDIEASLLPSGGSRRKTQNSRTRLLMTLGEIAGHLPQEEKLPFLGQALDTAASLEKPELADVLLPTMHQWFPDFGYETDQSYVPAVLESLGESKHMNRKGTYMFGKAAHRVTTMGGTDARAELQKDLQSLKLDGQAAFHDRGLRLAIPQMTVINKEEAVCFGAFGTAVSLALAAVSPVAAGIVWAGWSATALAAGNYEVDKTNIMKEHNPGSSLYPGPANYPKK